MVNSRTRKYGFLIVLALCSLSAAGQIHQISVSPHVALADQPEMISISSYIPNAKPNPNSVVLFLLDAAGEPRESLGNLVDNGTNGDGTAGDHIFTIRTIINEHVAGALHFRVSASLCQNTKQNKTINDDATNKDHRECGHTTHAYLDFSVPIVTVPILSSFSEYNSSARTLKTNAVQARQSFISLASGSASSVAPLNAITDHTLTMFLRYSAIRNFEIAQSAQISAASASNILPFASLQPTKASFLGSFIPNLEIAIGLKHISDSAADARTKIEQFAEDGTNPNVADIAQACPESVVGPLDATDSDSIEIRRACAVQAEQQLSNPNSFLSTVQQDTSQIAVQQANEPATSLIGEGLSGIYNLGSIATKAIEGAVGTVLDFFTIPKAQAQGLIIGDSGQPLDAPVGPNNLLYVPLNDEPRAIIVGIPVVHNKLAAVRVTPGTIADFNDVADLAPIAHFTLQASSTTATDGGTLIVSTPTGTADVTFSADQSNDPDGSVVKWQWNIDGVVTSSNDIFNFALKEGSHVIQLIVTDDVGLESPPATASVTIKKTTLTPTILFDGRQDPLQRFFFAAFQPPVIDSHGNLLFVSTHFGFSCPFGQCGIRANSVSPLGILNWQTPSNGSFISFNTEGALTIGQNDQLFIPGFAATLFSLDLTGASVPGWPVPVGPQHFQGPIIADRQLGTVYASGATTFSFSGFPATIMAINPDGTIKWRNDYPSGGRLNLFQGANQNIYTLMGNTLVGLDHDNGIQFCGPLVNLDSIVGGAEGIFGTVGQDVFVFDANCESTKIFTSTDQASVVAYADKVLYAINRPNPNDAAQTRLFAVTNSGNLLWIDSRIQLPAFQTAKNGLLYLFGQDIQDNFRSKMFVLDSHTGQIITSIGFDSICTSCDLAVTVADDGTLYVTDLNDARIFRLN